jgi:hypothetical protein
MRFGLTKITAARVNPFTFAVLAPEQRSKFEAAR